jgi:RNA polymerase sigma factor (sigma-70 family)
MGRWDGMNDRQLLEAYVAQRDVQAFGAFVVRHEASLLSFAAAFLRDETTAQDVVQETFLRAARNPQRVLKYAEQVSGGRNWLLKVVRDLSVDNLRRRATERRVKAEVEATAEHFAPAADAALNRKEDAARVHAAIQRLDPRLRELLLLKVQERRSYKEIAQITGLTVTNVGFLLHRAMKALSGELSD